MQTETIEDIRDELTYMSDDQPVDCHGREESHEISGDEYCEGLFVIAASANPPSRKKSSLEGMVSAVQGFRKHSASQLESLGL